MDIKIYLKIHHSIDGHCKGKIEVGDNIPVDEKDGIMELSENEGDNVGENRKEQKEENSQDIHRN